jgi:adenylate cyclase
MNIEIERKFLVDYNLYLEALKNEEFTFLDQYDRHVSQGYFYGEDYFALRVSVCEYVSRNDVIPSHSDATICMKFDIGEGNLSREEFEYTIPTLDGLKLLDRCHKKLSKVRCKINSKKDGHLWEVDFFKDVSVTGNKLIVAEIELESESTPFEKLSFLLEEVTNDSRYLNSSLAE